MGGCSGPWLLLSTLDFRQVVEFLVESASAIMWVPQRNGDVVVGGKAESQPRMVTGIPVLSPPWSSPTLLSCFLPPPFLF